jgi:dTMP kinase
MNGKFIVFEGIDGCGKSTQAQILYDRLSERGIPTLLTREPGGTGFGQEARSLLFSHDLCPRAELFLLLADRAQHCHEVIAPALARGEWVISDRFTPSTIAYQGWGRNDRYTMINTYAKSPLFADITFWIDTPIEICLKRVGGDRFEAMGKDFYTKVRKGYESQDLIRIDGDNEIATIADEIQAIVAIRLPI